MDLPIYCRWLTILLTFLSLVIAGQVSEASFHTNTTGHFVRQEETNGENPIYQLYDSLPKALLMLKDQQTFCQATLLSDTAAVLAASCFDYDSNKQADISQYNLAIEMGDANVVTRAQISNITPHPNYDPVTFANNIAVIRFTETITNKAYVIDNVPSLWETFFHGYYNLNADNTLWNEPRPTTLPVSDQNDCTASSSLFQAYQSDFICTTIRAPSVFNEGCNIPFKFIVDPSSTKGGVVGFYSHSSLDDNTEFCNNDNPIYNYYLIIAHYIPWINLLIDPDVQVGNRQNIQPNPVTSAYSILSPASGSTNGRIIRSLYKFADVLPVDKNASVEPPISQEAVTAAVLSNINNVTGAVATKGAGTVTETETETTTDTEIVSETITSISTASAEPVTVTIANTITDSEQLTNIVSTTQELTTTADHTTTVSETITTTDTTTSTETVTTTLLQTLTGTLTNIQSDTLTQSHTLTSLITTTAVSESVCPVVTCDTSVEVNRVTVTETEMNTSVEKQTVTLTELGKMTVDSHEFSAVVVTVTISQPPETITQTVASDQSVDPLTVTSIIVETLVISQTETLESNIESIFATVTTEAEPSSSLAEPEAETKSDTLQPWIIALIAVIIVVVLMIMVLLGYLYYKWKRRQRELYLASLVTPADYPQEYLNPQFKEKGNDGYDIPGGSNFPEVCQSRYNSKGSYVGYT